MNATLAAPVVTDRFRSDVLFGLSLPQKRLSAKYFYDAEGSRLFDQITELDEYYPTRTETALLTRILPEYDRAVTYALQELNKISARKFEVKDAAKNQASLFGMGDTVFEWDRHNVGHLLSDHPERGLSLAELESAFADPQHVEAETEQPFAPPRYIRIGRAATGRLLVMILLYKPASVRIFSAREANAKFTRLYHEANH